MTTWLHRHPDVPGAPWRHGWSDVSGPDFRGDPAAPEHATAVAVLAAAVGLPAAAWVRQVHGGAVLRASGPGCRGEADALWTDRPGLGTVGRSADCPLVLVAVAGPRPRWGFAHASWRSTVRGITAALLGDLADGPRATALIAPSARACCYEVGDEVRDEARDRLGPGAARFFRRRGDRWLLDLVSANRAQLAAAGVPDGAVHVVDACTICGRGYPSHRRDGAAAGRFAAVIGRSR